MYKNLKELYKRERLDVFSMAVSHLIDCGFRNIENLSDSEIEKMEGNGLMTADFVQHLVKLSREIAQNCDSPVELIQFCMAEEIFDIRFYADKPKYSDLTECIEHAINYMFLRLNNKEIMEELRMDEDVAEFFGLEVEENE